MPSVSVPVNVEARHCVSFLQDSLNQDQLIFLIPSAMQEVGSGERLSRQLTILLHVMPDKDPVQIPFLNSSSVLRTVILER